MIRFAFAAIGLATRPPGLGRESARRLSANAEVGTEEAAFRLRTGVKITLKQWRGTERER